MSDSRDENRKKKRNETTTRRAGRSKICLHKVAVCGVCMCFQLMITNDISEWPLSGDSFCDVTHSELLRTWQVNNIISSCVQTVPLTMVKYQHKANTAYSYTAAWRSSLPCLSAFHPQKFTCKTLLQFQFFSTLDSKLQPNIDIEIPNIGPSHKTKCDMTCTRESARVQPCRTNIPHRSAVTCILKVHLQFLVRDPFNHPGLHVLFM